MSPFCWATDTPVLDFWWHLLWVSKPEWGLIHPGATPADLFHNTEIFVLK